MPSNKPKVLVFKRRLLELSETFIKEQVLALSSWSYSLVGYKLDKKGLDLTGVNIDIIPNSKVLESFYSFFYKAIPSVKKYFHTESSDLIHIHFATQAVKLWPSIKDINKPVFITLHGADINIYKEEWESGKRGWLNKKYPKRLLKIAKNSNVTFIAVSEAIKQRAMDFGIPESKIQVSYIGINVKRFTPSKTPIEDRPKKILFVGRFVEKKAPVLLIEAFSNVLKKVPEAELVMIGTGPLLGVAKQKVSILNAPVKFLGAMSSSDIAKELQDSRVFCLPSVTAKNGDAEGFGIVILEAMASGVPVVTSARGGAHEGVIHNKTGVCFTENSLEDLEEGLVKILSDDSLAQGFVDKGLERVCQVFDNKITAKHLERLYSKSLINPTNPVI